MDLQIEILENFWHLASTVGLVLLGVVFAIRLSKYFGLSSSRALLLYVWHTAFCLVYLVYVFGDGGDALTYYRASLSSELVFSLGTRAVVFITALFSSGLGLSVLGVFLVYNIFGYVGLLAVDGSLQRATMYRPKYVRYLATIVVFLPSISFWSAGLGKDSIAFLSVGLALWASQDPKRQRWLMTLAIGLMFVIRPHMAALLAIAFLFSVFVSSGASVLRRAIGAVLALVMALAVVPVGIEYSGLEAEEGVAGVVAYAEVRQGYNMHGGGGIDISDMSMAMRLFTYLFRPLPFEAHSIPALAASLDNVILFFIVLAGGWQLITKKNRTQLQGASFLWVYSLAAWVALSLTTANLGISVRQKWMFVPMLLLLFISAIGKSRRMRVRDRQGAAMAMDRAAT
jgi:hypothetical protein